MGPAVMALVRSMAVKGSRARSGGLGGAVTEDEGAKWTGLVKWECGPSEGSDKPMDACSLANILSKALGDLKLNTVRLKDLSLGLLGRSRKTFIWSTDAQINSGPADPTGKQNWKLHYLTWVTVGCVGSRLVGVNVKFWWFWHVSSKNQKVQAYFNDFGS